MKYSDILDDLNEPIAIIDSSSRIMYVNKYFYTFAKINPRIFSSAPLLRDLLKTGEFDFEQECLNVIEEQKVRRSSELKLIAEKSGKEYQGIVKMIPIHAAESPCVIWTFLDFTNEFELQGKYRDQVNELVNNHNLIMQSNKHRAIGEVYETISHEINNPLTSSLFALNKLQGALLEKKIDRKELDKLVRDITNQVKNVSEIVLNLKRFLAQNTSVKSYIDLFDVVERSHELAKTLKIFQGIDFTLRGSGSSMVIWGNATELTQVFVNLFKNAAEAFNQADISDRVIVVNIEESFDLQQYLISIEDNGPGMSPAMIENLFDPFVSSNQDEGRGLGLSIVKKIVEDHGAEIEVKSELKKGAKFEITMPSLELVSYINNELFQRNEPSSKRLVLALRDIEQLNSLSLRLTREGYLVLLTNSIDCKQDVYTDFIPDLIITDCSDANSCDNPKILIIDSKHSTEKIIETIKKKL